MPLNEANYERMKVKQHVKDIQPSTFRGMPYEGVFWYVKVRGMPVTGHHSMILGCLFNNITKVLRKERSLTYIVLVDKYIV